MDTFGFSVGDKMAGVNLLRDGIRTLWSQSGLEGVGASLLDHSQGVSLLWSLQIILGRTIFTAE